MKLAFIIRNMLLRSIHEHRLPDNGKFYYIDYLDPYSIKHTPGGQTGVPAVPIGLLVKYTNDNSLF